MLSVLASWLPTKNIEFYDLNMVNHLDWVSNNIVEQWQKACRVMEFLRKMNQDQFCFIHTGDQISSSMGLNWTGKGKGGTYLTPLLSGLLSFFFPEELSVRCCPDNCLSDKTKPNSLKLFWLLMDEIWKWESGVMRNCSYVGLTVIVCGTLFWYLLLGLSQWITSSKFKFAKQIK